MHHHDLGRIVLSMICAGSAASAALAGTTAPSDETIAITIHTDQTLHAISPGLYGQFLEHIFNSVHGGLWGDQILNGTFELSHPRPKAQAEPPSHWTFVGPGGAAANDATDPLNADSSIRINQAGAGVRQADIALAKGESYTLTLYARGPGKLRLTLGSGESPALRHDVDVGSPQWTKKTIDFVAAASADAAALEIISAGPGTVNVDQVSLFSASARATGGFRPDLLKAVADLHPASIRWPGGGFVNQYVWENGVGPSEKRRPHPRAIWNDRDPYQFGTDEFMRLCDKVGAEPILVFNAARGVDDALNWLEYCTGDESTPYGKLRAANGHPRPYTLRMIEIDNEPWYVSTFPAYRDVVAKFCPAIRAKYPNLKLSVSGSYAYDTGAGMGSKSKVNGNWDARILEQAELFDVLSPHYYNGNVPDYPPDYVHDPIAYEGYLKSRGDMIAKSKNPAITLYVSEWNLTNREWGNDWRIGLYAGCLLNGFERQGDRVTMSCPALFMRRIGVTTDWDNALINFDQKAWFPAGNYVVMKLWRESFASKLLATDGTLLPLNYVATRSDDGNTIFLKVVNTGGAARTVNVTLDGSFEPRQQTLRLIAPSGEKVKNTIAEPDNIKAVAAPVSRDGRTIRFDLPAWSAGVVRIEQ